VPRAADGLSGRAEQAAGKEYVEETVDDVTEDG